MIIFKKFISILGSAVVLTAFLYVIFLFIKAIT